MNAVLESEATILAACADLGRRVTLAYRLTNGPLGGAVNWMVEFDRTVRFSLEEREADVVIHGDWAQMIRSVRARHQGVDLNPGVSVTGDIRAISDAQRVLGLAGSLMTHDVQWPDV